MHGLVAVVYPGGNPLLELGANYRVDQVADVATWPSRYFSIVAEITSDLIPVFGLLDNLFLIQAFIVWHCNVIQTGIIQNYTSNQLINEVLTLLAAGDQLFHVVDSDTLIGRNERIRFDSKKCPALSLALEFRCKCLGIYSDMLQVGSFLFNHSDCYLNYEMI